MMDSMAPGGVGGGGPQRLRVFVIAAAVMAVLVALNAEPASGSLDGGFYAHMADRPFDWTGDDEPFFSRVGVPLLVWLLPFGLDGFLLVTIAGAGLGAVLAYELARDFGGRGPVAAAAFLVSGPVWPATRWPHLVDGMVWPLAGLVLLLAVRKRPVAALAVLTCGVVVHETVLLAALPLLFLLPRRWLPALGVPFGLYLLLRYTPLLYGTTIIGGGRVTRSPVEVFERMSDYYGTGWWAILAVWAVSFGPLWVIPRWPYTPTVGANVLVLPFVTGWSRSLTASAVLVCAHARSWTPVAIMGAGQGVHYWWRPEAGIAVTVIGTLMWWLHRARAEEPDHSLITAGEYGARVAP